MTFSLMVLFDRSSFFLFSINVFVLIIFIRFFINTKFLVLFIISFTLINNIVESSFDTTLTFKGILFFKEI